MSSLAEQCSVVVVPYNHDELIEPCLSSVLQCEPKEVLVVDGGSTDDTREIVEDMPSPVELITVDGNPGYGACNNVGVEHATGEYVVILNPDTKVEPGTITRLLEPLENPDGPSVTVPKILTYDGARINTIGNINHFTGLAFVRGFGDPPEEWSQSERVAALSGACFAIRRSEYRELGGFDDSIFLYMEDVEFSWRLNAHRQDILYVPDAIVYHDYDEVLVDEAKLEHLEVGRYIILRKYLSKRGALALLPSLVLTEVLTTGYALLLGWDGIRSKTRAVQSAFSTDVGTVRFDARQIVRLLDSEIPDDQLGGSRLTAPVQRLANRVFRFNAELLSRGDSVSFQTVREWFSSRVDR